MLFADDAAICATTEEELQTTVPIFDETVTEFCLELAIKKTKITVHRTQQDEEKPEYQVQWLKEHPQNVFQHSIILVDNYLMMQLCTMKFLGGSNKHLLYSPNYSKGFGKRSTSHSKQK